MEPPRTYTVDEAQRALPEVRRLVAAIVRISALLPELEEELRIASYRGRRPEAGAEAEERLTRAQAAMALARQDLVRALRRLEAMGVQVKDVTTGLVDFLSLREGELIELCWRLGEDRLAHWHRIGEGFRGRKPLP